LAQAIHEASPESRFAVFNSHTLYCDAAGGADHGFIVVAGYLSTFEKWVSFAIKWNLHLAAYNLPYFHMKEFSQSAGAFLGWDQQEQRRRSFLAKAASIIAEHVERSFGCIVEFDIFERVNRRYRLSDVAGVPYSLAGINCVAKAGNALGRNVNFVFEDGDIGKGELMRIMGQEGYPSPYFSPSSDVQKNGRVVKGIVQLQAADFAAYELRKVFKDDPTEAWPLEKYRKSLRMLASIGASDPNAWSRFREEELVVLCKDRNVGLR
jgi:hypothetical protein